MTAPAGIPLNFDARSVQPAVIGGDPVPSGWYTVRIKESEMKPTNKQDGSYMKLGMEIIEGEYAGRMLYDQLNLQNPNPVTVEIAWRTLSSICHATGVIQLQNSQQLHGIPLKVKVVLKPAGPGADGKHYEASNDVKGYVNVNDPRALGGAPAPAPNGGFAPPQSFTAAPPAAPAPAPAPAFAPPQAAPAPAAVPSAPAPTPGATTPPWQQAPVAPAPAAPANAAPAGPTPPWARG